MGQGVTQCQQFPQLPHSPENATHPQVVGRRAHRDSSHIANHWAAAVVVQLGRPALQPLSPGHGTHKSIRITFVTDFLIAFPLTFILLLYNLKYLAVECPRRTVISPHITISANHLKEKCLIAILPVQNTNVASQWTLARQT